MAGAKLITPIVYEGIPNPFGLSALTAYQAGSDGSIWSPFAAGGSRVSGAKRYKQLKGCIRRDGYRCVALSIEGNTYHFLVHRLILLTFKGPCPVGMEACHQNGVKADNRIENLRYDTHASNIADKFKHGTVQRGEQIIQAKLTETDVNRIKMLVDCGIPQNVVADCFGLSTAEVCRIANGLRWKHA